MVKQIRKSFVISTAILVLLSGCGYDNEDKNVIGDNLILTTETFTPVVELPKEVLGEGALAGIKSYKINYMTTNHKGEKVKASGLITIPALSEEFLAGYKANLIPGLDNPTNRDFSFSIVSDQHGTIFTNAESPSKASQTNPNTVSIGFSAQALFMTVQPDYLGYGDSNETHPFIIKDGLANTTVDIIKAAIAFANKAELPINGQVYLSGYSEGGYATMAAAKEIQENHPEITLKAVAPMASPSDVETMAIDTLSAPMMAFPPFLAYLAHAYAETYDDINISEVVNAPYASMLPTLFDLEHNSTAIYFALPNIYNGGQEPDKLFVPNYSDDLIANSDNALRQKFAANSVLDWTPQMPMRLYHCVNDMVIPYKMSELALTKFTDNGSTTVEAAPISTIDSNLSNPTQVHAECGPVAYKQTITWFNQIRSGGQ